MHTAHAARLIFVAFAVGCSASPETTPALDDTSTADEDAVVVDDAVTDPDTSEFDSALPDTRANDSALDTAIDTTIDTAPSMDSAIDTAPDTKIDSAIDSAMTDVADSAPTDAGPIASGWRTMSKSPLELRNNVAAAWTGTEVLIWGGNNGSTKYANGAAYNPSTNTWRVLPTSPLNARVGMASAWTGTRFIVWGGLDGTSARADGALYDPVANTWTSIASAPVARGYSPHAWHAASGELFVRAGQDSSGSFSTTAIAYSPSKNTWRTLPAGSLKGNGGLEAVALDAYVFFNGGIQMTSPRSGAFDPVANTWTTPSDDGITRSSQVLLPVGPASALVWGGQGWTSTTAWTARGDGYVVDVAASSYLAVPASPLSARSESASCFGQGRAWIWGGTIDGSAYHAADGASYDPMTRTWALMPVGPLGKRSQALAVCAGSDVLIWAGHDFTKGSSAASYLDDGAMYRP